MCGIIFSITQESGQQDFSEDSWNRYRNSISARGPDSLQEVSRNIHLQSVDTTPLPSLHLRFLSSVLALRGDHVCAQPLVEAKRGGAEGNILCWNGQIFEGISVNLEENDTEVLFQTLNERIAERRQNGSGSNMDVDGIVTEVFESIEGPYAFVYYDERSQTLYFGRDVFGRRSLLMPLTASPTETTDCHNEPMTSEPSPSSRFILSSVRPGVPEKDDSDSSLNNMHTQAMQEVDCRRIWALSLRDITVTPERARIPSLNQSLPSSLLPIVGPGYPETEQTYIDRFVHTLSESVRLRVCNIPPPKVKGDARLAILFSGGVDCAFITHLAHQFLPQDEPIDLLNVAFENPRAIATAKLERQKVLERAAKNKGKNANKRGKGRHQPIEETQSDLLPPSEATHTNGAIPELPIEDTTSIYDVPDRITGRETVEELRKIHPEREWRFVEINVEYQNCQAAKPIVLDLMYPSDTEMDLSLALPLWFAARRSGSIRSTEEGPIRPYTSAAKVLMSGLGADELLGGYARHRRAFEINSWQGAIDEMQMDLDRLPFRNLGRDDRIISSHGVETRFPYLSLTFANTIAQLPIASKCDLRYVEGVGDKSLIRVAAHQAGLVGAASKKKRAMQFGTRSARMEPEEIKQRGMGKMKIR
ncbi:hypothetical protein QFC24_004080 [Naganishia onofrii]|uniref:Uncharacterized protein n=1 Tax=Naganishia onofrii TaxID=1851511 RepID=A0ACC2XHB4_9TREE|nr:hypothetical protein QFC24_004080 [Naganishia onofrii]